MVEVILVIMVLFVAFSVFFPGFSYKSRWDEAMILLKSRDVILTSDRINKLYNFSFSSSDLQNFMDEMFLINKTNILFWKGTDGTVGEEIVIACNCTQDQMKNLNNWLSRIEINSRQVDVITCYTNLEVINPCLQSSSVLLIWGRKDFSGTKYKSTLEEYMRNGNGIVEIADLTDVSMIDTVQASIFGLRWESKDLKDRISYDRFRRVPDSTSDIIYGPYKYFYHLPISITTTSDVFVEGCDFPSGTGTFIFNRTSYNFWTCDSTHAWFDANADGSKDTFVGVRSNFNISGYNFTLSYVRGNKKIGISFVPEFHFADFLKTKKDVPSDPGGQAWGVWYESRVYPSDDNVNRILVDANKTYTGTEMPIPVVILNSTGISRAAWMADFSEEDAAGHDQKLLLTSLLFWASNKKSVSSLSNLKIGYTTSYVNVNNEDIFEVYKFDLGLGFPFS